MVAALISIPTNGSAPVFTSRGSGGGTFSSLTLSPSTPAAGEALLAFIEIQNIGGSGASITSVKDTLNNVWFKITETTVVASTDGPVGLSLWFCPAPANASTSFTFSTGGPNMSASVFITGIKNLSPSMGIPSFTFVNAASLAGIVPLGIGGTGSDLSGTGGAHKFLTQAALGAGITVVRPDYPDLAGQSGALAGIYNGVGLVGNGLVSEVALVDRTVQSANVAATTLYFTPSQQMYRVSAYVVETVADAATSTLPNVQLVYTDFDSNTSVTLDVTPIAAGAGLGQTAALTANVVGLVSSGVVVINPKAATTIQYQTVNYASGTPAAMKYALHLKLEAL